MRKSMLAAAAAISMISVSSGAVAQSAAPLSLSPSVRAGADMDGASNYRGGIIIPALILIAVIGAIYLITKGGSDNATSP